MSEEEHSEFDDSKGDSDDDEIVEDYLVETEDVELNENEDEEIVIEGDLLWVEEDFEDLESTSDQSDTQPEPVKKKKLTKPYMTKFEFTKIIGVRAEQIMQGSQIFLPNLSSLPTDEMSPITIAVKELKTLVIPLIIRRKLMDKHKTFYEDWKIEEFKNIDNLLRFFNYKTQ